MSRRGPKGFNREALGVLLAVVGAVMLFLGWYGVSGRPNLAEQMPYIASATVPGAALVVAAAVLLMSSATQRNSEHTGEMVADLHALLVEDIPLPADPAQPEIAPAERVGGPPAAITAAVTVIGTVHYHRGDCALVTGKADIVAVDSAAAQRLGLTPCPMCEPALPTAGSDG